MSTEKHNLIIFCRWLKRFFDSIKDPANQQAICRDEPGNSPAFKTYNSERIRLLEIAKRVTNILDGRISGQKTELSGLLAHCAEYHRVLQQTLTSFERLDSKEIELRLQRLNEIHNLIHQASTAFSEKLDSGVLY